MDSPFTLYIGKSIVIFLVIISISSAYTSPKTSYQSENRLKHGNFSDSQLQHNRNPKFFPILGFVQLPSSTCQTTDGRIGACMKSKKCARQDGVSSGPCGMNFGVCCIVNKMCSGNGNIDRVTVNGTHITQPAMFNELCRFEIARQDGVCQIRLDFNDFSIDDGQDAGLPGDCNTDMFTISGASNSLVGPLCGNLKGQHMYLDYGTSDKINLDFLLTSGMSQKWDISVTMIRCDSSEKAPDGCLQYYTTQTGMVKSFNYNNKVQLNNQDYTVCIRANVGMRKISWKSCMTSSDTSSFFITGVPLVDTSGNFVGTPASGDSCTLDWVMVLGQNKYCGSGFPDSVTTTSQPFILQVHFNEYEVTLPSPAPPAGCGSPTNPCPGGNMGATGGGMGATGGATGGGMGATGGSGGPMVLDPLIDDRNTGFCLKYTQSPF